MGERDEHGARPLQRLGVQLIGATLLVLSVASLVSISHTIESEQRLLSDQLDARGRSLARLGATACVELYLGSDYPRIETIVSEIARQDSDVLYCRAELPDGEAVHESFAPGETADQLSELCRRYQADVNWEPHGGGSSQHLGRLEIGLSTRGLAQVRSERTRALIVGSLVSYLALAALLSWLLRRKVDRPLERLDRQAQALGRGELDTPVRIESADEIGRLASTLDTMRVNLRASDSEIRARNEELQRLGTLKDQALSDLGEALEGARAASRAKDEFLATVSHELRTPLNGVIGMTDVLLGTGLDRDQRECTETLRHSAETLLVVVNDVLDFSRLDAGRLRLAPRAVLLRELVSACLAPFRPAIAQKGLWLRQRVGDDVPDCVLADPVRLRQILTNLVGNALKFTERGGITLEITLSGQDGQTAELLFTVADTGIGIPPEARPRLFQPFVQGDGSITRRFGGTGLGLVIAQRLAQQMGGGISYESEPGRGSSFAVLVRLERADPGLAMTEMAGEQAEGPAERRDENCVATSTGGGAPLGPAAGDCVPGTGVAEPGGVLPSARPVGGELAAGPAAGSRVLLVEDNPVNQRVAVRMLRQAGCQADVAQDGVEGVERCAAERYALVLMDLSMPRMDGLEATRRIRANEEPGVHVPIVALTANAVQGDRERCIEAGMDDYLTKPLRAAQLEPIIARFCPLPGPSVRPAAATRLQPEPAPATGSASAPDAPRPAVPGPSRS